MRLGLSSYAFTWAIGVPNYPMPVKPMGVIDLVERAAELGVFVVQVADNLPLDRLSAREAASFVDAVRAAGVAVEVGTRGIGHEHLRIYLDWALRLGAPFVRVVVDTAHHHPSVDEVVESVRRVMPEYGAAGVKLAIENHDRFPVATLVQILERIDSPYVGICLDTVNSFGSLEGPAVVVDALGPWTINLHVKDFEIRRAGHNMGFTIEGRPAGQGMLDVPWLLQELKGFGCECNAIIELWTPPQATIEETVALEDRWAQESVAYMRTLLPD
jgi:sugar phosphate isomerase/epimerase